MKIRLFIFILLILFAIYSGYKLYPFFSGQKPASSAALKSNLDSGEVLKLDAVVIENLPEARPAFGLSQAEFVFETLTEAGITRFLAFFSEDKDVSKIGPVRSARPYFVDWTLGFGTLFAHSGGSKEALAKIDALGRGFKDLNEFNNEKSFWRDASQRSPHNLFTSTKLLSEAASGLNWNSPAVIGWEVEASNNTSATSTVNQIDVDFSYPSYFVVYKYNSKTNFYERFIAGKADVDSSNGKQISTKNVVVLFTTSRVTDPQLLTINLETLGSDRAVIFRDGGMLQARWKKTSGEAPLELLDADDSLIKLNEGPAWFAIVDQNSNVNWK